MTWLWLIYAAAVMGILLWGVSVGLRFKGTLKEAPLPAHLPLVSTIVPARNEERNIGRCAGGLTHQTYENLELIFVDDESQDATPDILADVARRDKRVQVVHTGGKPGDWNGKQWACHSGALAAHGDWLCFMDADTYAEPELISRTLAFAEANGIDFLTLQPWYEMLGLWERIVLPSSLVPLLLFFPPHVVNNPQKKMAMANGQFILIRKAAYEQIDGHAGVRSRMMDDYPLAENARRAGLRLFIADGADVMRVRLYTNLREIWSGALKTSIEITGGWLKSIVGLMVNFAINVLPVLLFIVAALVGDKIGVWAMGITIVAQVLIYAGIRIVAFRLPPWSSVTYPLGGVISTLILLDGMLRLASGRRVKWKDREVLGGPEVNLTSLNKLKDH